MPNKFSKRFKIFDKLICYFFTGAAGESIYKMITQLSAAISDDPLTVFILVSSVAIVCQLCPGRSVPRYDPQRGLT